MNETIRRLDRGTFKQPQGKVVPVYRLRTYKPGDKDYEKEKKAQELYKKEGKPLPMV